MILYNYIVKFNARLIDYSKHRRNATRGVNFLWWSAAEHRRGIQSGKRSLCDKMILPCGKALIYRRGCSLQNGGVEITKRRDHKGNRFHKFETAAAEI